MRNHVTVIPRLLNLSQQERICSPLTLSRFPVGSSANKLPDDDERACQSAALLLTAETRSPVPPSWRKTHAMERFANARLAVGAIYFGKPQRHSTFPRRHAGEKMNDWKTIRPFAR